MSHSKTARITVYAGLVMVVAWLVAALVFMHSGYPDSNDGAAKIAQYFTAHRDASLWQQFTVGIAMIAGICFAAGLVTMMWADEDQRPFAVISGIGAAAAVGTLMAGSVALSVLAYRTPVGDAALMRTLLDVGYIGYNASGFAFAAFVGAAAIGMTRMHLVPAWNGSLGVIVAGLQVVGAATFARGDGAFSPQGWVPLVCALMVLVWVLAVCVAVWRPAKVATPAPSAPAPA